MIDRKVVPFDEFYYQLKLMHLFLLHPVYFFQENLVVVLATICRQKSPKIVGTFLSENISKNKNEECACNVKPFLFKKYTRCPREMFRFVYFGIFVLSSKILN
jgi:hypothetical protein